MILPRDPISIFLVKSNTKIEKKRKRNGENINKFFKNVALELFKWVLLAKGISN